MRMGVWQTLERGGGCKHGGSVQGGSHSWAHAQKVMEACAAHLLQRDHRGVVGRGCPVLEPVLATQEVVQVVGRGAAGADGLRGQ